MASTRATADLSVLRASGVAKAFQSSSGSRQVLRNIDLEVDAGEIVSVIGRSGGGKSTLLRLLGGLIEADEGGVTYGDIPVVEALREKTFGLMPQSPALMPWRNVRANVHLLSEVNTRHSSSVIDVDDALRSVGLLDRADAMPYELSGGMKQRVAMARALATRAPVLLLDEPFSSLDEITRNDLYQQVLNLWCDGKHTLVLVTHNIVESVLLSDRVIVLGGSPASIVGTVAIDAPRPRQAAIDSGELASVVAELRRLLDLAGSSGDPAAPDFVRETGIYAPTPYKVDEDDGGVM